MRKKDSEAMAQYVSEKKNTDDRDVVFLHLSDRKIFSWLLKMADRYDLNPDTNEDYRRFLIGEGVLNEDNKEEV